MKIRRRSALAGGLVAALVTGLGVGAAPAQAAAANTLTVQADQAFRPVTHVATGSLYGLADGSTPGLGTILPIKPSEFVQMAADGQQQPTGDITKVAGLANQAGAKVVDRFSDYYSGFPYNYDASTWDAAIDDQIAKVKNLPNLQSYALWNEPDNTWKSSNGTFENFWTNTYRYVRSKDATTPIQGPSFSDNISDMDDFLSNAVATNTVPDIIAWHELENSSKIAGDIQTVTALEQKYGITPRPIDIEEYAAPSEVGIPGDLVGYIAKFERLGVAHAELAFWNQSGALGDLLTGQGGSPNGAYWLYTWYAGMTGNMVTTTPSSSAADFDGAAALTSDKKELDVVVGGGSGATNVVINGLGSTSLGGSVSVQVQSTPGSGRTTAVSGPTTLSTSTYPVSNGSITVPISSMDATAGYHIVVTPASDTNYSGTDTIKNVHSGLVVATQNGATASGTPAVQAAATGAAAQKWTLRAAGNDRYTIVNTASGQVLGIQTASSAWGAGAVIWGDTGTADHLWRIDSAGSGQVKIVNVNSGLVLGVSGASTAAGATLVQWGDTGTSDHLWTLTAA